MFTTSVLIDYLTLLFDNLGLILLVGLILWERSTLYNSLLLQPLRGGNGITQMDELAKYVMLCILIYMIYMEGKVVGSLYPESVFWAMIIGVALIAGIKEFAQVLNKVSKV